MSKILVAASLVSLILTGAIFGFFYAWVCSTMWGLDATDPRVAIAAMQAMNESVRNAVFAPAFFGTPIALWLSAGLAVVSSQRPAAIAFAAAGLVYLVGGLVLTMSTSVPMNEAFAALPVPPDAETAARIWRQYSHEWQFWNHLRTVASGLALVLCGCGLMLLAAPRHSQT